MISLSTSAKWSSVSLERLQGADKGVAYDLKARHVAADEGAPNPGVQTRQTARDGVVAKQGSIGGQQPIENDRLRPFLQTSEALGWIGRRHGGFFLGGSAGRSRRESES